MGGAGGSGGDAGEGGGGLAGHSGPMHSVDSSLSCAPLPLHSLSSGADDDCTDSTVTIVSASHTSSCVAVPGSPPAAPKAAPEAAPEAPPESAAAFPPRVRCPRPLPLAVVAQCDVAAFRALEGPTPHERRELDRADRDRDRGVDF